ncbi:2-succinyl-5-enolpyruvyl-6-hydroxy-3-cyclohexene-1-carboxylic-acid synthase [Allochromatium vinosum]|uniref:2-succinyl-5-enolpyruvyl-6-hydroxy-3-cyclohexene-1-carboxylate synthase n=1 Tax=Allochromatium vinosum (strain ATCC 17899 / DSM 180 / NBRC 103801 / NCIMB 10441 / D) TaxID=572477 RepID=D3RPJ5_ALLVD|nr:2-succinyl-5-enolpyruvyl-6-hydroxy-3-cyclohexene-1-carboxylic-acid synthase [Allochromatium vinosum]ADC61577.1 2-succinyl-6-hydroxy-2,4-cyclohexadiene-1-carboxylic acid synthase/2-oxoglutarate decarboxylase [Allochromatium vinosum DSM 180]MBK1654538.1 2-succinyl-5-enolpyruvyl-6-hydroxy-3-cyclohexene-1-carboxylate synthase [Allochromatium vinosum]
MTDQGCLNLRWALALFDGLVEGGMRHLVLSPGSRSTPLVLAAQRQPALTVTPILDERSAAFFALGVARASGRPVGLVCTSGSALAHWFPAVIEASESGIPLVLLSADRPPELRGWGANQTIDQTRFFGVHVRAFHDPGTPEDSPGAVKLMRALGRRAAVESQGDWPGPVHLNLPFREPLVPGPDCRIEAAPIQTESAVSDTMGTRRPARPAGWGLPQTPPRSDWMSARISHGSGRGVICCGPGDWTADGAEALWHLAMRLEVPVLCDPLSGLRFGCASEHRLTRYDSLLRHPATAAALKPDWVLRFGRAPVSKTLLGWLADVPTILVDAGRGWSDPNHDVRLKIDADPAAFCVWLADADPEPGTPDPDWFARWLQAERRLERFAAEYLDQAPWCEGHLIRDLIAQVPEGEGLLCANSMPIRQLDTWSGSRVRPLRVFGHRGASGIDGQTSTLAGLNAGGLPTTGLLGDLSFLHDLSGLPALRTLSRPCIVINNGGGRIFDYLPQHGLPGFETLWRTPVAVDLRALAGTFGLAHRSVSDRDGFRQALTESMQTDRPSGLIEVVIDADLSRQIHRDFWRAVSVRRDDA